MKLKWKNKTAVLTVLEVWRSEGITRAVIWDSIRGLVTLEHVWKFPAAKHIFWLGNYLYFLMSIACYELSVS